MRTRNNVTRCAIYRITRKQNSWLLQVYYHPHLTSFFIFLKDPLIPIKYYRNNSVDSMPPYYTRHGSTNENSSVITVPLDG